MPWWVEKLKTFCWKKLFFVFVKKVENLGFFLLNVINTVSLKADFYTFFIAVNLLKMWFKFQNVPKTCFETSEVAKTWFYGDGWLPIQEYRRLGKNCYLRYTIIDWIILVYIRSMDTIINYQREPVSIFTLDQFRLY